MTGKTIKDARERAGMTQSQLAQEIGISVEAVRAYEQGRNDINRASYDKVIKIIKLLGIDPEEF